MDDNELRTMLIDYMGKGFLENIIALMKQEPLTVRFIPDLLGDDSLVVRLGATALVEELVREHRQMLSGAVLGLLRLLDHENPTVRGDAANVLGIIGDRSAKDELEKLRSDVNPAVRQIVLEALAEMGE